LTDLDNNAPKPHTDFRAVYTTLLDRRPGMEGEPFRGARFTPLDIIA
jgi:hypothetical protein